MAEVGYRAIRTWWVRAALGVVLLPVSFVVLGSGVMLLTTESLAGVLGHLLSLSLVLFLGLVWFVGTRVQFLVDDEGITIVHYVKTHRIPWEQVAVIEQSGSYWTMGAAVVVLPTDHRARDHGSHDAVPRGEPLRLRRRLTRVRPAPSDGGRDRGAPPQDRRDECAETGPVGALSGPSAPRGARRRGPGRAGGCPSAGGGRSPRC